MSLRRRCWSDPEGHCASNLEPLFALILGGKGWQLFYTLVWHGS